MLAQQVQLLLDCVAIAAAAAAATGRRLPVVDRANAADDRCRDLGFGITFCSYDCTVMLILLLLLKLSLMVVNATSTLLLLLLLITGRPADLRRRLPVLLLVLRMSPKRTSGPVASAAATATTGAAAVCGLLGLGC